MDEKRIAEVLYELCLDLDYMDYKDTVEEELDCLASEIKTLKDSGFIVYNYLERLAIMNEDNECPLITLMRKEVN